MAPRSSTLAWKIPWMEEPGGLQSMGSLRVRHDWTTSLSNFTFMLWGRKWQPTPVFLPRESQGQGEPGGLPSMGSHRVGHDWSALAAAAAWNKRPSMHHIWGMDGEVNRRGGENSSWWLILFWLVLVTPSSSQYLSSPTRDRTWAPL